MDTKISKVGKRGQVVIPKELRDRLNISSGSLVVAEERPEGVLFRPAVAVPVEVYPPQRRAEFLLNNATDADDYGRAVEEVRRMGLDPDSIPHTRPERST